MRVRVLIDWLVHDGARRAPGDVLDLPDPAAETLIALRAVEPIRDDEPVEIEIPIEELEPSRRGRRRRT